MTSRSNPATPAAEPGPTVAAGRSVHATRPRVRVVAASWVVGYTVLAAFPVLVLLLGDIPKGGGRAWDFAMALGFGGLAIMGLQFILTARFRRATAPFGVDIIYYFHRLAAIGAFVLIAGHYVILRVRYGDALGPLNPLTAPWHMTAGRLALGFFLVLIISSLWRRQLRLEYDRWRVTHAVFAAAAVVLAFLHIQGVGHYTNAAWKGIVWTAYTGVWILVLGYVRIVRPWSLWRAPYRVAEVRKERGRAWTVVVEPLRGEAVAFKPGQFAWLTLRSNPFRAKEHPFSFSGSASRSGRLEFTIKELGDFTRTVGSIKPGEIAYVDGPHGIFTPDNHPEAPGFTFVAGGVGIAPIMSMLRTLADRGETRPLRLVYGNRAWENVLFREELEALRSGLALEVSHVLQEPPPGWPGLQGVLSEGVLAEAIPPEAERFEFFLCGPKPMSDAVQNALRRRGIPLRRVHCELFEMV